MRSLRRKPLAATQDAPHIRRRLTTLTEWIQAMSDYYRPQEILVLEAEVARSKAYLARLGVPSVMVEGNVGLLTELVIEARREVARGKDVSQLAASRFRALMLGPEVAHAGQDEGRPAGRRGMADPVAGSLTA